MTVFTVQPRMCYILLSLGMIYKLNISALTVDEGCLDQRLLTAAVISFQTCCQAARQQNVIISLFFNVSVSVSKLFCHLSVVKSGGEAGRSL